MNAVWQQREEARKSLWASPNSDLFRKAVEKAGKNLDKVRKAAVLSFFLAHVRKLEKRVRKGDQAGFYEHLKTMEFKGKRDRSSQLIKDEDGNLLRVIELIRKRRVRWFSTLLNIKPPTFTQTLPKPLTSGR